MSFTQTLDSIFDNLITLSGPMVSIAQGIGAIGALLYVGYIVFPVLASPGTEIDFMKVLRPFGLALVLMLYPSFMGVFDGIPRLLSNATASIVESQRNSVNGSLSSFWSSEHLQISKSGSDDSDLILNTGGSPIDVNQSDVEADTDSQAWYEFSITGGLGEVIKNAIISQLLFIGRVIGGGLYLAIYFLRTLFLSLLYIFGPIVIALSIFPGFEGMFVGWIKKYISIHIWLPVAHIIETMSLMVGQELIVNDQYNTLLSVSEDGTVSSPTFTAMMFLVFNILAYISVPIVANMIINSGGGTAGASRIKRAGSAVATKGASLAK